MSEIDAAPTAPAAVSPSPTRPAGFAASVTPIAGDTVVHTSLDGLEAGFATIPVGSFELPAYVARPASGAQQESPSAAPIVLVISEIFGVHEHIADVARRFAKRGYLAIAPDLFVRQGDPTGYTDIPRLQAEIIEKVPDAQVMGDLDATLTWAAAQGGDLDRLGITGFCWGGRITWLYAAHQPKVRAGVAWYGKLKAAPTAVKPLHPVDVAPTLRAPVLGLYGLQDQSIPQDTVAQMQAALSTGGAAARASEFVVYQDAGHAFHADYRPSYRKDDAIDGWRRCLDWFEKYGVRP